MSTTASPHGALRQILVGLRDQARSLGQDLQPWLRREAWTTANLRSLLEVARRDPRRALPWLGALGLGLVVIVSVSSRSPVDGLLLAGERNRADVSPLIRHQPRAVPGHVRDHRHSLVDHFRLAGAIRPDSIDGPSR